MRLTSIFTSALLAGSLFLISCGSDNENENNDTSTNASNDEANSIDGKKSFTITVKNISKNVFWESGVANTPDGAETAGPALPGNSYTVEFEAVKGHKLSFATMLVKTNDWFFAPDQAGIALYDDNGQPITGDITDQIKAWDAGTEEDEPFGAGESQPLNSGDNPDKGTATTENVAEVTADELPAAVNAMIKVELEQVSDNTFRLKVSNLTDSATPITPVVWATHSRDYGFFKAGEADMGNGLEQVAEAGNPEALSAYLTDKTGPFTPFAPIGWVIQDKDGQNKIDLSQSASTLGLEKLAEDGSPEDLVNYAKELGLEAGSFNGAQKSESVTFAKEEGPILPGDEYRLTVTLGKDQELFLASMYVQSNDLFLAPKDFKLQLWDSEGNAVSGDITDQFTLFDAGTEENQRPGFGADQPLRQAAANTGAADENDKIRVHSEENLTDYITITVEPSNE